MGDRPTTEAVSAPAPPAGVSLQRFSHDAMASTFEVLLPGVDSTYGQQVALELFAEVDRLENELSRFVEASDIWQINTRGAREPVRVGMAALECLLLAADLHVESGGAFDITLGSLLPGTHWADENWPTPPPDLPTQEPTLFDQVTPGAAGSGMQMLKIDPETRDVALGSDEIELDLGGIGKGYALDHVAGLLGDWSISAGIIHAGQSSVYAMGAPPAGDAWSLALRDPTDATRSIGSVRLRDCSLSGSGLLRRGHHIIDPQTGQGVRARLGTWAIAPSAAVSDAMSTALMLMSPQQIRTLCERRGDVGAMILSEGPEGRQCHTFGNWDTFAEGDTA